ncbi:phosphopantetheine-binding protein [Micromonospora profundi]|uniref:acyl carrier protein n=1 Tax=Micromonospora profundi TaxID=1420889 RepID=UPI0033AAEEF0
MSPADRAKIRQVLMEVVEEVLPFVNLQDVTDDRSLRDLGADSLDRVEIISAMRDRLGNEQALSSFADLPDIAALIEFLDRTKRR